MWVVKESQAKTRNNNTIDKQILKNLNAPYFQTDTFRKGFKKYNILEDRSQMFVSRVSWIHTIKIFLSVVCPFESVILYLLAIFVGEGGREAEEERQKGKGFW